MKLGRAALAAVLAASIGCGASDHPVPEPDLAKDLAAHANLAHILATWERGAPAQRAALELPLTDHISRFSADPSARTARAMLSLIALEKGDVERASALARPLVAGPRGSTHDVASIVMGSVERRRGAAKDAAARLTPMFQRVIDPVARLTLNRELVMVATMLSRWDDATKYLQAYVRQAPAEQRAAVGEDAAQLARALPPAALLRLLEREQGLEEPNLQLSALLAGQVADSALEREDVALARSVLELAGPLLGDRADAVARIAARGAAVRLDRNTVGMILPLRNEELRRRAIEAATGLGHALGLPGGKIRLVTRDDQGDLTSVDDALALLNADGAAVIVAGFDTKEADVATAYAERTGLPVLLLRPPTRPPKRDGPVFVLGESPHEPRALLAKALGARGHTKVAALLGDRDGSEKIVAEPNVVGVQACGASLDFLKTAGADALVLDGGATCAADAAGALPGGLAVAFGLDAGAVERAGLFASSGIFPDPGGFDDPLLAAWRAQGRGSPSWWTGLGHDAGVLARAAVVALPEDVDDQQAAAAAARKGAAIRALASAEGTLWTTAARGFGGQRVLARDITVEERGRSGGRPARPKPKR